jgi:hypothetical protein
MEKKENLELEIQNVDIAVSAMRSSVGVLPIVGPLMGELVGYTIPNQRFDRLVKFCKELDSKLSVIDNSIIKLALQDENFTDLLEESLRQSVRSLSDERRKYIASIIANSLTQEKLKFIDSKRILRILGEINDIEVIWLRFYYCPLLNGDQEFRKKHEKILNYEHPHIHSPKNVLDKETLQENYRDHLVQLGLLKPEYQSFKFTQSVELVVLDNFTKSPKISRYEITSLGNLLIQHIDLNYDYQSNFPR